MPPKVECSQTSPYRFPAFATLGGQYIAPTSLLETYKKLATQTFAEDAHKYLYLDLHRIRLSSPEDILAKVVTTI